MHLHDELEALTTEARNPAAAALDTLSGLEIARLMNAEDRTVADAVAAEVPAIGAAIDAIAARLGQGGRLIHLGAGTSGRLGVLDAVECPPTFHAATDEVIGVIAGGDAALTAAIEGVEDQALAGRDDLLALGVGADDAVVGIAASGRTPYVLGGIEHARQRGALTIGLSCNAGSPLAKAAELAITPVVGAEVLTGSTRLKAGTATKMVLNMLSTGAMVRRGRTYGNLMVDVAATNAKLRSRAHRIVRQATGLDAATADALLERCAGEVKTCIVCQGLGVSAAEARARLRAADGRVRAALEPAARGRR